MLRIKQQVLAGLKSCGYKNDLLKESYQYFDGKENKTAEIVGFSQPTYNSSTACIAAIDKNKLNGNKISSYQSLGCPVLFVFNEKSLQFWKNDGVNVTPLEEVTIKQVAGFFKKYEDDFSPENIYRAKTIGRVKKEYQLTFGDIGGLMGIVEEKEGKYLSELTERIIKSLKENSKGIQKDGRFYKWLFQAAFWLIGAKILKDKQVERFKNLKISEVDDLISRIQRHYNTSKTLDISNKTQKEALSIVASRIVEPVETFSHITTESLAYVYENALVGKETRQALGTHATPSWLVNYMVWELVDWIEEIPTENRIVLEPACGHAPFLTASAKLLSFLYKGCNKERHDYLKSHLKGIEKDGFAIEIARLALTLADIPNSNGWNIQDSDIYEDDVLKKAAQKATILFSNPPFEDFKKEKQKYNNIETGNKAAEVLLKTLPYMSENSVFGVILPRGFLHKKNLCNLRKYILSNFEIRIICNLPENVFAKASHLSTILLARKKQKKTSVIAYLKIKRNNIENFKKTYQCDTDKINQDFFFDSKDYTFRIPELKEVWDYCKNLYNFGQYCEIGRGIEYKSFTESVQKNRFSDAVKGFGKSDGRKDTNIAKLPDLYWLSIKKEDIANERYGLKQNTAQIIANYIRSGSEAWRIKGYLDYKGLPTTNSFLVIRSKTNISLLVIWALINSPFTNAYMYCHCMERHNLEGVLKQMPVPFDSRDLSKLEKLAQKYFEFDQVISVLINEEEYKQNKKQCLLEIDAEILRLYNLPPRLEKKLLDFFEGIQRRGVDFEFDRYYPEGFGSYIPLHILISEEFQNSTVENVKKWVEENRSPEIIDAFKNAVKDFEGR